MSRAAKSISSVAYVIVCWNNSKIIKECIESIDAQTYKHRKIFVVDNGSTDDSAALVRKHFPHVRIIETGKNNGFAIANNIGIQHALEDEDCHHIALINTDARIDPTWTTTLVSFSEKNPHVASMQSPTLDYYDHSVLDSFGITVDHFGRAVQLGYRSEHIPTENRHIFGINFAAGMITREFLEAQPFKDYLDEDIWMYIEDVDFAARATIMGWHNWLVAGSYAYHMGSASSSKNPGFSIYLSYRNNLYMIIKNFPFVIATPILFGAILTDIQSYYRHLRGKNFVAIKAMLRARFTSITHCGVFFRKRRVMQDQKDITTKELWKLMNPGSYSRDHE